MTIEVKFKYNPEIDDKVKIAIGEVLKVVVLDVAKFSKGEVNHVYKIITNRGIFVARIFSSSSWPEKGVLDLIDKKLSEHNIRRAKLVYRATDDKYFPNGFEIAEYIEGKNGWEAIKDGTISFEEFHLRLGKLLKKIHSVPFDRYGYIGNGIGTSDNYIEHQIQDQIISQFRKIDKLGEKTRNIIPRIEEKIRALLLPLESKFRPSLTHGDAGPDNCILMPDGEIVLVDWDNAMSSIWVRDLAILTYWGSHLTYLGTLEERRKKIIESFLKGYGEIEFSRKELMDIEKALHIIHGVLLLPYYYEFNENDKAFKKAKDRLFVDLG